MRFDTLHTWELTPSDAVNLQRELAERVETRTPLTAWELVAGADVSYNRFSSRFYAGVVVLRRQDLTVVERRGAIRDAPFPYVPGLLSFREAPALLAAFAQLKTDPDVVLFDGQGIAHPRRLGIAAHLGLWLDRPSIGCAKSVLVGTHRELGGRAGAVASLQHHGEEVGAALRTKDHVRPVYVSVGHRIDLASALRVTLECCRGYRIPEPIRQAHLYVNALRRADRREEAG